MVCVADLHRSYNDFYNREVLDERDETKQLRHRDNKFIQTYQKFVCFKDLPNSLCKDQLNPLFVSPFEIFHLLSCFQRESEREKIRHPCKLQTDPMTNIAVIDYKTIVARWEERCRG